ncbi:MAG: phosphonopyruvate decarboxylase [Pseudomonadota bacterium]
MIEGRDFVDAARARGFALWSGVPCSYLTPFLGSVAGHGSARYVAASNEGEAVAVAVGAQIGGMPAIAMFQNSGLGNAVNPLSSLAHAHRVPVLVVVTLRGDPDGPADEPQHALMGAITTRLLELLEIRWEYFPEARDAIEGCLQRALDHMSGTGLPFALVMRKGCVAPAPVPPQPPLGGAAAALPPASPARAGVHARREFLAAVLQATGERDILVSTTGYTSRELYALQDRPNQLYVVGAMGCASSVGLGLALARPDLRITVLDGDGAALMRMGALAAIGVQRPANLLHVVLDNGMHESTGGQASATSLVDLAGVAAACGYPRVWRVAGPAQLAGIVSAPRDALGFACAAVAPGIASGLPRPRIAPPEATSRLRRHIGELGAAR